MKFRFEVDQAGARAQVNGAGAPSVLSGADARPSTRELESDDAPTPRFIVQESVNFEKSPEINPPPRDLDLLAFSESPQSSSPGESDDSWRHEVSARLSKYQARKRPREPRYPSLQLKFEPQEVWRTPAPSASDLNTSSLAVSAPVHPGSESPNRSSVPSVEPTARIIEFPRSLVAAPVNSDELADPVFERPRILEAPEIVVAPPALGGILIEKVETPALEKRPGFEMPLRPARMVRRLGATLADAFIVLIGVLIFAAIFWRIVATDPPLRLSAAMGIVAAAIFWAGYQYILIVHCGTTPGLKLAKLRLSHFDGTSVPRKRRRWRVVASALSGLSLGLGYAWCFLDEDQLCWHDRITRTYIAPNK